MLLLWQVIFVAGLLSFVLAIDVDDADFMAVVGVWLIVGALLGQRFFP